MNNMDLMDKLERLLGEINYDIQRMTEIIRGEIPPCKMCIGCEMQDDQKGICVAFKKKEQP